VDTVSGRNEFGFFFGRFRQVLQARRNLLIKPSDEYLSNVTRALIDPIGIHLEFKQVIAQKTNGLIKVLQEGIGPVKTDDS
jgi:hypothetical protein